MKCCKTCLHNAYTAKFDKLGNTVYCSHNKDHRPEGSICPWWHMERWFTCGGCDQMNDALDVTCGLTGKDPIAYCGRKCDMSQM